MRAIGPFSSKATKEFGIEPELGLDRRIQVGFHPSEAQRGVMEPVSSETMISTRRFCWRPLAESLSATG